MGLRVVLLFIFLLPLNVFANDSENFTSEFASTDLGEFVAGNYATVGSGPYSYEKVKIEKWAGKTFLTGIVSYGKYYGTFEMELRESANGEFYRSEGTLSVKYSGGMNCRYPMSAEIYPHESATGFYVMSTHQRTICGKNCRVCTKQNLYTVRNVPPYLLTQ
jgi:hypothetical protein